MFECFRFIFKTIADFCAMLFTIDIGDNVSLGLLLCIIFILLPCVYRVITFIKHDVVGELDEMYDESRPRESLTATREQKVNGWRVRHTYSERRRLR